MRKLILLVGIPVVIAGLAGMVMLYNWIWKENVNSPSGEAVEFLIPTGSGYEDVFEALEQKKLLNDPSSFQWVARKKNYPALVKPGRYMIKPGMGNNELVGMLRSGSQEPVMMVFNNIRSKEKLAGVIGSQIEADSVEILALFANDELIAVHGLSRETVLGAFIPNTYEMYWNTSAEELLGRMMREFWVFWNEKRLAKARKLGMDPMEVITLAAIVDEECLYDEEHQRIAGVFINRLEKRIRLHADPTVRYAAGDMNMSRVLRVHLQIDSPYNTYRRGGLPPGPIVVPSISAIDGVLDYEHHNYLYFCAKEDFSGYHNFASTIAQHNKNARSYQNALNQRKIFN